MNATKSNKRPSLNSVSNFYDGVSERLIDYLSVIGNCWTEQGNQICTLDQVIGSLHS